MLIKKCCICGESIKDKFQLSFRDIVGIADFYTQHIGICPSCGFIFTMNPFSDEQLGDRYKNFSKFEFDSEDYFLDESDIYKIRSQRQKDFINRTIGIEKIESVLEIGAASGYNLSLYDCDVYGVEPSDVNCKNALRHYGVNMFCGVFEDFFNNSEKKQYDLIFLSHVLEHIINPHNFIRKCSLVNSKYVFIEVPTFDYKFIDEPYGMFCEEHVNMFTFESLVNLMTSCGYKLINAEIIMGIEQRLPAGWPAISTVWEKNDSHENKKRSIILSEQMLDSYLASSEIELKRVNSIILNIPNEKKVAIWGTGHHASMLLSNTALTSKKIVRVYDSDKKKFGLKMNGIPIQPFCSDDIDSGIVETIVVATYTAQNAILKALENYVNKVEIITFYDT